MILTVLLNGLWQGGLAVAATAGLLRLLSPRNAATRYAAWFCALIAIAVMPLLTTTSRWGAALAAMMQRHPHSNGGIFSLVPLHTASSVTTGPLHLLAGLSSTHALALIAAFWFIGAAAGLLRLTVSLRRIAGIRRTAAAFSHVDGVPVLVSNDLTIPIAAGVFSPVIVLPSGLAQKLTRDQLFCAIEHELAHHRRGDVATNLIQRIIEALLFWNPWVYVAGRKLVCERECACDDRAAMQIGESVDYASCLAALGRIITAAPMPLLTPSAFGSRNALVNRIERLTAERSRENASLNYVALGALTMLLTIMTLALQALIPAPLYAASLSGSAQSATLAASSACTAPNAEPKAIDPAAPDLPKSEMPPHKVSAIVAVTVGANGKPTAAKVYRSSGYPSVDRAVVIAAQKSKYSPKVVDCAPVQSTYLFRADFAP
ncbi:MAG TPA: TonB family protein [Candidatus Cybelea sp.]|nr:TonB family protein [Candidatus Cybelea sp.]